MSLFCTVLSTVCQSVHHWWYFSFIMVLICGTQPVLFRTKKNILAFSSVVSTEWPIWSYVIENERMERISNLSESIIFVSLPLPAHNLNGFYLLYGLHDWHICSGSIMGLVWFQEPHKKQCPLHWREGKGVGGGRCLFSEFTSRRWNIHIWSAPTSPIVFNVGCRFQSYDMIKLAIKRLIGELILTSLQSYNESHLVRVSVCSVPVVVIIVVCSQINAN